MCDSRSVVSLRVGARGFKHAKGVKMANQDQSRSAWERGDLIPERDDYYFALNPGDKHTSICQDYEGAKPWMY